MDQTEIRHEGMRIGGEIVFTDDVVEVKYPYTEEVVGTVPAGTAEARETGVSDCGRLHPNPVALRA